jgi:secreted PhoX family phosphatase
MCGERKKDRKKGVTYNNTGFGELPMQVCHSVSNCAAGWDAWGTYVFCRIVCKVVFVASDITALLWEQCVLSGILGCNLLYY